MNRQVLKTNGWGRKDRAIGLNWSSVLMWLNSYGYWGISKFNKLVTSHTVHHAVGLIEGHFFFFFNGHFSHAQNLNFDTGLFYETGMEIDRGKRGSAEVNFVVLGFCFRH